MRLPVQIAALLCCLAHAACKHSDHPGNTESAVDKPANPRVWIINGQTIPVYGSKARADEPIGPDASLAGPGMLEEAIGAAPSEPLPTGAGAPTLEAGMLHDTPPASEPQSPFDPALKDPAPAPGNPPPAPETKPGDPPEPGH